MKETLATETVETPVVETSAVENNGENIVSTKEQLLNKGEERYEKTAQFISDSGEKVKGWIKTGATKLGRFFKGAAVRAFAAPDAVAHGVNVMADKTGEGVRYGIDKTTEAGKFIGNKAAEGAQFVEGKITEGAKFVGNKIGEEAQLVKEGAQFVGGKIVEGAKSVGDDFAKLDKYTTEKAEQAGEWIGGKAASVYEFSSEKLKSAKNFTANKAEQAGEYLKDKALTLEAVGSLVKEKTSEKLNVVGEKLSNGYEKVAKFGQSAVETATLRAWYAKDAFNAKINSIKKSIWERKAEKQGERYQKTLNKLKQFETVGNLEASLAL